MASSYTQHERLVKLDALDSDWSTAVNSNVEVRERGRHLYAEAGENLGLMSAITLDETSGYLMHTELSSGEIHFLGLAVTAVGSEESTQAIMFGTMSYGGWDAGFVYPEYAGGGGLVQSGYLNSLLGSYSIPIAYAQDSTLFLARAEIDKKLAYGLYFWDAAFYLAAGMSTHAESNHHHVFPHNVGCFTTGDSKAIFVSNTYIKAGSVVCLCPGGNVAAEIMASDRAPYVSATEAGTGFWINTANGSNFTTDGNENYLYQYFE